jgi:chromosome segregation ATPase
VKSWFAGTASSVNSEIITPFSNAEQIIYKYNQAIEHNSLTQQGWQRLIAQCDDGLASYLTNIKGSIASMSAYSVSLQGNITGYTKITQAMKQYNALGAVSQKEQQNFATAVSLTNAKLGSYLTGLNGAKASLSGYGVSLIASTAKTVGLTIATTALNAALTFGISAIITGVVSAFATWINSSKEITEAAEEAKDKIASINDDLKTNTETVENAKQRYAELAQEVENLGKVNQSRGSLSTDEYEEFLDLSNQLADVFPQLSKNYDDNGNAILNLSGDVDTIVGSLDDLLQKEKDLANQKIIDEFPDVYKGYVQDLGEAESEVKSAKSEFDKINNAYQQLQNSGGMVQAFDKDSLLGTFENEDGEEATVELANYIQALEDLNIAYEKTNITRKNAYGGDEVTGYLITATGDIDTAFTSKLETARKNLQYAEQQLEGEKSSIDSYLNTWLQSEFTYNQIDDSGLQTAVQDMIMNFDFSSLPDNIDKNDWNAVSEYLRRNILFAINDVQDNPEISKAISEVFTNQDLTPEEKANYLQQIKDYFDDLLGEDNAISISLQPQIKDTDALQKSIKKTADRFNDSDKIKDFFDTEGINTDEEVNDFNKVTEGINDADKAIQKWNEHKKASEDSFEIPDADTLKQQISDLNSAIDSIQSAYDTLNSAVEEYNSNGGQLSIDTIQSLLSLSDEYLACLQVENGQLSLNADAMAQLAQAKLDEAQATAVTQAMTELQAIANGEAAQSTTNYITGNAALMDSLAQLSGSYEGVAQAAMTAAQAQELSAQISAASAKDKTATENVMKGLDTKLKLIQSTKNAISAGNFASVSKKSSSSGSSSKSSKDELKEQFQAEYDLLKHNLEMEYITEEDYYNGVQALNEKYFAGKEEYLDDYRKYEEEVYKGLKSYYKSYCDDMMDYYDKKLDASKMSYKEYCDSVSKMLADMHNSGKISDKDWYDYTKTMLEKQKDAYDRALSAITRRLQKEIDAWQAKIDALNDQNDALNDQKDNYDKILSAVSNVYDKEIDRLNEQKDLLQDQIDALNDKNDALDLQYRKEQALYALQKAQQQRTRKLYVEGKGYIYDTDNEAIRDAQKDLDDITNEELINSLQKEQDKIQESIDILEKYKEKWNEIPDAWDKAVSEQLAIELWGQEYEKLILMNRTSDIENFKTKYLKIQSQINDNEQLIKSYEEKVEYYTKLKEQWQSLTDEYSNSVDDMYAKMLLGQSWESDVLNGRLSTLNDFRNQYNDIQKSISDMAWQSANAQISALNAVKAAEATKAQTSGGSNGYSGSSGNVSSVSKPSQPQKDTVQHYWIYRTLGTFNTNGQASSKIGMLGGDGVISVGGKYLVVKWKKGYVTRGEASSNIVNYGGNGVYKRYASGTDNAKKGWNIVSEENPELIIRNNGEIDLAKGEQFYNFQGGEKVIPANETKEILKNQGNVEQLSDSDVITRKDGSILKPIHYEYENMLTNFIKDNPDYMYSMNTMSDNMCRDLFKNAENVNYDNRSVDNKVSIGEIHLHEVPNVDQFARELDRQLAGIVDQKLSRRKR